MNIFENGILIIFWIAYSSPAKSPYVVTRPVPCLDFYYQSTESIPFHASHVPKPMRPDTCKRILNSQYFKMRLETYVDPHSENILPELKQYNSKMFSHYYIRQLVETPKKHTLCFLPSCFDIKSKAQSKYIPVQPYIKKTIYQNDRVYPGKVVMPCLARQTRTNQLKEYFITLQLRPTETSDDMLHVYFIASYNIHGQLVVEALVEEPSSPERNKEEETIGEVYSMELEQFFKRNNFYPPYTSTTDALCGELLEADKLRICASIMNSLSAEILFWPTKFNVSYKRDISTTQESVERKSVYDCTEWVLICKARKIRTNKRYSFYIPAHDLIYSTVFGHCLDGEIIPG